MKALLDFWQRTPLNDEESDDFSVYVTIYDNRIVDKRMPVIEYPIAKVDFAGGVVAGSSIIHRGVYGDFLPEWIGWTKRQLINWLEDEFQMRANRKLYIVWRSVIWAG